MNALSYRSIAPMGFGEHDHIQCEADDREQAETDALEAMRATPRQVEAFLMDTGADVSCLVSLLLDRGLPLQNGMDADDCHWDRIDSCIDNVKNQFDAWAKTPRFGRPKSPLQYWMEIQL